MLIITLDTTRADHIGIYGNAKAQTPNIDAIARKGVRFRNAYTPVPLTFPSHCTIFTGTLPLYHNVRNNGRYKLPDEIRTLAEILKDRGFTTAAFVSSFTVDSRFGLNQGFQTYNDNLVTRKGQVKTYISERSAALAYEDFAGWFRNHSDERFFVWVHFFDPHMPYTPPEPFKTQFRDNPYDGEIAYMDTYIGKIFQLLEEKQVFENTLVVLAGDHGEAFGEHGEFGHMMFCYEENIKVPLIFYSNKDLPHNKTTAARANLTDIMPTILDFLGIPLPAHQDGISLLPVIKGSSSNDRMFYIESVFPWEALGCAPVKGILKGKYKFIDLPKPELYDLEKDPGEKENLYLKKNIEAKRFKQTLTRFTAKYDPLKFKAGRPLSAAEERKLRTLGYFSMSGKKTNTGNLPDPKEKIGSLSAYIEGNRLRGEGRREEAVVLFKRAIEMNPSFSWPYSSLALVYTESGKPEEALATLKEGILRNPEEYQLKIDYATLLKDRSRIDEAVDVLEGMRGPDGTMFDTDAEVNYLLGDLYAAKGNMVKAASGYREALKVEPENRVLKQKLVYILHQSGKLNEALELYLDLEKNSPDDSGLLFNLAVIYDQLNRTDRALVYMERFMKVHLPEDALKKSARQYLEKWRTR